MTEQISLEISNYWTSNDFLTESNKNCGTLVAFDWSDNHLTEINTNIDLGETECVNFKFDNFVSFLQENNFTFVLGLRNIGYSLNPCTDWTNKLKEVLSLNKIDYDEYNIDSWPAPIPEFDVPDNIFILRYSFDEYNKIDEFAANNFLFVDFLKNSDWEEYYTEIESENRMRVIVLCSDIENLVLHGEFIK